MLLLLKDSMCLSCVNAHAIAFAVAPRAGGSWRHVGTETGCAQFQSISTCLALVAAVHFLFFSSFVLLQHQQLLEYFGVLNSDLPSKKCQLSCDVCRCVRDGMGVRVEA